MTLPSTTMPSGGPRAGSQTGKRFSSTWPSSAPSGRKPMARNKTRLATAIVLPRRLQRVSASARPTSPRSSSRFDGTSSNDAVLESRKNISGSSSRPRSALVLFIGRIEAGELLALLHLLHQPAFHELVLGALVRHEVGERGRDHHRAIVVGDDDVIGKDGAAAAADRLVPADESELVDGGRRRQPAHQTGRPVATTPCLSRMTPSVTSAVTPRLTMRMHKMSPKMPAPVTPMASATTTQASGMASMAARVEIGFDQFRRRQVLAHRHEAQREGLAHHALAGKPSGMAPAIQERRMPFFNSMVVMVPVVMVLRASRTDMRNPSGERLSTIS